MLNTLISDSLVFSAADVALRAAYAELRADPSISCLFVDDIDGGFSVVRSLSARSVIRVSHFGLVTLRPIAPLVEIR